MKKKLTAEKEKIARAMLAKLDANEVDERAVYSVEIALRVGVNVHDLRTLLNVPAPKVTR